jgi:hypothetical protein
MKQNVKVFAFEGIDWYQWNQNMVKLRPLVIMIINLLSSIKRGEIRDLTSSFTVPK